MIKKLNMPTTFILIISCVLIMSSYAASASEMDQAKVLDIKGEAKFMKAGTTDWKTLELGMILTEGDSMKTGANSEATLELSGAKKTAEIVVRKDSEFSFATFRHDETAMTDQTLLDVETGGVLVKAEKLLGESKFQVKTPTSIVGIRGTVFEVYASQA